MRALFVVFFLFVFSLCAVGSTPPLQADQVVDHGDIIVTVHDQPIADLSSLVRPALPRKIDTAGDWLVLPRFEVDTLNPNGVTTLFAVRNVTDGSRQVIFRYYTDGGGSVAETVTLGPKQVRSVNLRDVAGLTPNPAGIASGYVDIIDSDAIQIFPQSVIQGDYFLADTANNFASGDRLVDYTNFAQFVDLCSKFELRFLNGGAFNGGTDITVFTDVLQTGSEFVYAVYTEAGTLVRSGSVNTTYRSAKFPASFLADSTAFGVIEIVFNGTSGHASSVFSALGRFSVGLNGLCEGQVNEP